MDRKRVRPLYLQRQVLAFSQSETGPDFPQSLVDLELAIDLPPAAVQALQPAAFVEASAVPLPLCTTKC
jgi:hypothetical protein